jgi:hypothetical protein
MLSTIDVVDLEVSNIIMFNLDYFKSRLSHHLTFQIQDMVHGKNIHHTVLNEESSTRVMYLSCWRDIGSLDLNLYPTTLKKFYGCGFQPYGLLKYFIVELRGSFVSNIDIKVVDMHMDYNLFPSHSWLYAMNLITSSVFCILQFPNQGKIVVVDQIDYCTPYFYNSFVNNIPFLG